MLERLISTARGRPDGDGRTDKRGWTSKDKRTNRRRRRENYNTVVGKRVGDARLKE